VLAEKGGKTPGKKARTLIITAKGGGRNVLMVWGDDLRKGR